MNPEEAAWLEAVRDIQTPTSIELERQIRAWLEDGTLPTLKLWHGRSTETFDLPSGGTGGGDCEVTAFALYRDLRRAKLDTDWALVCGFFSDIGRHYWNVYRLDTEDAQAVNVNLGRVFVIPLSFYLHANECESIKKARPETATRLYACASRMGNDPRRCSFEDALALDAVTADAFGMRRRLRP